MAGEELKWFKISSNLILMHVTAAVTYDGWIARDGTISRTRRTQWGPWCTWATRLGKLCNGSWQNQFGLCSYPLSHLRWILALQSIVPLQFLLYSLFYIHQIGCLPHIKHLPDWAKIVGFSVSRCNEMFPWPGRVFACLADSDIQHIDWGWLPVAPIYIKTHISIIINIFILFW